MLGANSTKRNRLCTLQNLRLKILTAENTIISPIRLHQNTMVVQYSFKIALRTYCIPCRQRHLVFNMDKTTGVVHKNRSTTIRKVRSSLAKATGQPTLVAACILVYGNAVARVQVLPFNRFDIRLNRRS